MEKSKSLIAFPPGITIKEQLNDRKMSQKEFALRMGMSEKHISKLINGEVSLTMDVARRLEMVLGLPALFWCNLESIYREKMALIHEENEMDLEIELAKRMPYKELVSNGWILESATWEDRVITLRKFFEVARLRFVDANLFSGLVCRKLAMTSKSEYALFAWAQKAKLEARDMRVKAININYLEKHLSMIRSWSLLEPEEFCPKLIELLSNCGIALVFLPHIDGSFLYGATFVDNNKIIVGLTVRGKDADKFWFSLFHELGHIIHRDNLVVDIEKEADLFAENMLIPLDAYHVFTSKQLFTKESIIDFSNEIKIDVGIVVGRLQKDGFIKYSYFNDLKTKYDIS